VLRFGVQAVGSPSNGDFWRDSTQEAMTFRQVGLNQFLSGSIYVATSSFTDTGTASNISIVPSGVGTLTIPANYLVAGRTIRIRFGGAYSTSATSEALGSFRLRFGSVTVAGGVGSVGGSTDSAANQLPWHGEAIITCRSTGASGTVTALMVIDSAATSSLDMTRFGLASGAGSAPTVTVNTTGTLAVDLQYTSPTSSASHAIWVNYFVIEVLN
jgi:hypothetical protein